MLAKEGNEQNTALHIACRLGYSEIAQLLLSTPQAQKDKPAERWNDDCMGALHEAVRYNRPDVIKILLENGANPSFGDKNERTALHWAAEKASTDEELKLISRLLEGQTQISAISARDRMGRTPLHEASRNGRLTALGALLLPAAGEKQNSPHPLTFQDDEGDTPLHLAALNGQLNVVEHILGIELSVDHDKPLPKGMKDRPSDTQGHGPLHIRNKEGRIPLHSAVAGGHLKGIELLAMHGIDETDLYGNSLLHLAAMNGHLEAFKYVLEKTLQRSDKDEGAVEGKAINEAKTVSGANAKL